MRGAVGPFTLGARIGAGGMGEVWRAEHTATGAPVAIKVLRPSRVSGPVAALLRAEVRAVAALDHPAIVAVLDAGGGDRPWMAMELATGGTLATCAPGTWPELRAVLLGLLDGLAHAHAAGVVHRDLKPSNVLLGGPSDHRPGWKLADFGLADMGRARDTAHFGSPGFMSPEQLRGRWRDFGPWTDIYGLGCLVWSVVCGHPPYTGTADEVAWGHLRGALPRLTPALPVPAGLEAWLGRCLRVEPERRFPRAVQAAGALRGLGAPRRAAVGVPTLPASVRTATQHAVPAPRGEPAPRLGAVAPIPAVSLPPAAPSRPSTTPIALRGAGLGLVGLRADRLVGRERVQERLWTALVDTHLRGGTRIALVRGPSGCGKSALALWLSRAAHAAGAEALLAAHHTDGARDGLAHMLRARLAAEGLSRDELAEHLARWGRARGRTPLELAALLQRLHAAGPQDPATALPRVQLAGDRRHGAISDAVSWIASDRPAVVWLDDLQWGDTALAWARWQLGRPGPMVVATVQEEALAERPGQRAAVDALSAQQGVEPLSLDALAPEAWPELVRGLLGLEGELAHRVEERTRGNPLFARQLVGDWVSRGQLELGTRGFRLRPGARVDLPETLASVWVARIDRLADAVGPRALQALTVLALLGVSVDPEEWAAACAEAKLDATAETLEPVATAALLTVGPDRLELVHGMFREALVARCPDPERRELHLCCARALRGRGDGFALDEREARHLLAGGLLPDALAPLWRGAMHRMRQSDYEGAHALLDEREELMSAHGVAETDVAWPEGWAQRGRVWMNQGAVGNALDAWDRALQHARSHGGSIWIARAALVGAGHHAMRGDGALTEQILVEIAPYLDSPNDAAQVADARASLAIYERRFADALAILRPALLADITVHHQHQVWVRILGCCSLAQDVAGAEEAYAKLHALNEQLGMPVEQGNAEEAMGVLYHVGGDYDRALAHYRRGIAAYESVGGDLLTLRINVALASTHAGRLDEAEAPLAYVEERLPDGDHARWAYLCAVRARLCAASGDRAELSRAVDAWEARLERSRLVDTDIDLAARQAAIDARAAGHVEEAERMWAIACVQREAMGLPELAEPTVG